MQNQEIKETEIKNKKNSKLKRTVPAALMAGLCLASAGAWLTTNQTATSTNSIKPGQVSIKFENEQNAITLTNAMPMSDNYANENTTEYTFDIANKGNLDLNYKIYVAQTAGGLTTENNVRMKVDNTAEASDEEYKDVVKLATIGPDGALGTEGATVLAEGSVNEGEKDSFTYNLHLSETVKQDTAGIQGESATYQLFVVAEQAHN